MSANVRVAGSGLQCHYFVDEAGDGNLFSRKGRNIVGLPGCSRFFILGLLEVRDIQGLGGDMDALRKRLLADPYLRNVPSMQAEQRKTALAFHAKDDIPEVRQEVFKLLMRHDLRFFAVVKSKHEVLEYVRQRNQNDPSYRYHPNELYDFATRRLFRDRLRQRDAYRIVFAKRGKSDRTAALREALNAARERFRQKWGVTADPRIRVEPGTPRCYVDLQASDYLLWALQRVYERREDRYLHFLWEKFRLVQDVDDRRQAGYGVHYTQKKPLTAAALEELPEI